MDVRAIGRFCKYSVVGVATFALDLLLLYYSVTILGIPYYVATPIAFLFAVSCNYALSRAHVFKGSERSWEGGYTYFIAIAICGAVATTGLVTLLVTNFEIYYMLARIFVAGIIGVANYAFNLYFNFRVAGAHPE
jgi:putative flippase GtrA